jgi:sugar lactone lactonase YvrE
MRRFGPLAIASWLLAVAQGAHAQSGLTQGPCLGAPDPVLFASWESQLENLAFDGAGSVYVSDSGRDRLLRFTPDGGATVLLQTAGLIGLVFDPGGRLYIGAAMDAATGGAGPWQVWRFDDTDSPEHVIYAEGLPSSNGMAFDPAGNLYVSNPLGTRPPYLVKIPPSATLPAPWSEWWTGYGPNGLVPDAANGSLLAAISGDGSSPIVRLPFADPSQATIVADLSFGFATLQPGVHEPSDPTLPLLPKGLDDLTLGPDGRIYLAAHLTGEILRVDPTDGSACVLASGLREPTSVRFAHGFGGYEGDLFITINGGIGVSGLFAPAAGSIVVLPMP